MRRIWEYQTSDTRQLRVTFLLSLSLSLLLNKMNLYCSQQRRQGPSLAPIQKVALQKVETWHKLQPARETKRYQRQGQFLQASLFPDKLQYLRECLEQRGGGGKRVSLKSAILAHPFATTNPPMASLIPKHQKQKGSRSWLVLFVYSFLRLGGLGLFWILCLMLVMTR